MISIDIDGPSAVGKTTLIHQLCNMMHSASFVDELLMQKSNPYSKWETPEDFLKKQLWFFEHTLKRYAISTSESNQCNVQINDIGIIDVIIHTAIYPIANKLPWNIFLPFKNRIMNCYPNLDLANIVLYLYASEETIRQRKSNDSLRVRNAFESNILLYPLQKKFYFMLNSTYPNQVICFDAELNFSSLIKDVTKIIQRNTDTAPLKLYDLLNITDTFFF